MTIKVGKHKINIQKNSFVFEVQDEANIFIFFNNTNLYGIRLSYSQFWL